MIKQPGGWWVLIPAFWAYVQELACTHACTHTKGRVVERFYNDRTAPRLIHGCHEFILN